MSTDLKNKESSDKNPIQKEYDKKFKEITSEKNFSRDGVPLDEQDSKAQQSDLAAKEKSATRHSENDDGFFSGSSKESKKVRGILRGLSGKKKGVIGGVGGVTIALIIFLFPIVMGPLQFVHIAQILLPSFDMSFETTSLGNGGLLRRLRYADAPERARLGFIGNRVADKIKLKLELDGVKIKKTPAGYMESIKVDGKTIPVGKGGTPTNREFRKAFRAVLKEKGYGKIATALMSRPMFARYGVDLKWLGNVKKRVGEKLNPFKKRLRENAETEIRKGVQDTRIASYEDERRAIESTRTENGSNSPEVDQKLSELETLKTDVNRTSELSRDVLDAGRPSGGSGKFDTDAAGKTLLEKMKVGGKGSAIVAAVGLTVCFTRNIAKQAPKLEYFNKWLPSMRMGMKAISIGSQIMAGEDIDADEISVVAESLVDEQGRSWAEAEQINYRVNGELTGVATPPDIRVGASAGSGWVQAGENLGKIPFVDNICSILGNGFVQVGLTVVEFFFSGGLLTVVSNAAQEAFTRIIVGPLGESILRSIAGVEISSDAAGPRWGNIVSQGADFSAVEMGKMLGGTSLDPEEAEAVQAYIEENNPEQYADKSFYNKFVNPQLPSSTIGSLAMATYKVAGDGAVINFNPLNFLSGLFSQMGSLFTERLLATSDTASSTGISPVGYTVAELKILENDDPFASAEYLLDEYGKEGDQDVVFGPCLSEPLSLNSDIKSDYYLAENLCEGKVNQNDFLLYRFQRFIYEPTLRAIGCYSGDEVSCTELGVR